MRTNASARKRSHGADADAFRADALHAASSDEGLTSSDGAADWEDISSSAGKGSRNWRVEQLVGLLEEVSMLENEVQVIRREREMDRKELRTMRQVVIALLLFHMAIAAVIAMSFRAEWMGTYPTGYA